jgi:hypothetical protein
MEKRKHDMGLNRWLYRGIWTLAYTIAWGSAAFISMNNLVGQWFGIADNWEPLLFSIPLAIAIGAVQYGLIRRTFALELRGWIPMTILGWFVSGVLVTWITETYPYSEAQIVFVSYYLFPAIAQWWLLRKHIVTASLWILASVASALVFVVPMSFDSTTSLIALGGALQGLLLALVLEWLVTASKASQLKAKNEAAALAK